VFPPLLDCPGVLPQLETEREFSRLEVLQL